MNPWQPIETAPKGDKWTLLGWTHKHSNVLIGRWCGHAWIDIDGNELQPPTHWMPLPEPPAEEQS
jgi:hypothetical protein